MSCGRNTMIDCTVKNGSYHILYEGRLVAVVTSLLAAKAVVRLFSGEPSS
jgi:hypothetical protein